MCSWDKIHSRAYLAESAGSNVLIKFGETTFNVKTS